MQDFHPLHERSKRQPSGERNFLSKTNQFSSSIELVCAFHKLIKERVYLCNELLLSSILKMSSITYYDFVQVNVRRLDCCCSELVYLYMKDGRHSPWDLFQPKCWEVLLCSLKRSMVVGIGKWCDGGSTASFYELGELSVHWTSYLVRSLVRLILALVVSGIFIWHCANFNETFCMVAHLLSSFCYFEMEKWRNED